MNAENANEENAFSGAVPDRTAVPHPLVSVFCVYLRFAFLRGAMDQPCPLCHATAYQTKT